MQEKHSRADSSVAPVEPEWPHPDDVRRELNRIINSSPFRDAYRLTSFLSFIVEMTLMGHSKKLKAYTIAVEALDRGADFDPQVDPIVRVEAVRLRQALARYYSGAGRDDPLVIEVSRGSYVPAFRHRNASDRHKPGAAAPPRAAAQAEAEQLAEIAGQRQELSHSVMRFRELIKAYRRQVAAMAVAVGETRRMLIDSRVLLDACERLDLACGAERVLPTAQPCQPNAISRADGRETQRQAQGTAAARLRRSRPS